MAEINKISRQKITLDIGGYKFSTSLHTLRAEPESMLGTMFSGRHPITKQEDGSVFIDRDGTHFRIILNYLRGCITSSELLPDNKLLLSELLTEVNYYQLKGFEKMIKPEEKESPKVITQEEIFQFIQRNSSGYHATTKALSFKNCQLNSLHFEHIIFNHPIDFSGSSLMNTTFKNCYFSSNGTHSFDRTDLRSCKFENCWQQDQSGRYLSWRDPIMSMSRFKFITFRGAKNIDFASFDSETIRNEIKIKYCL